MVSTYPHPRALMPILGEGVNESPGVERERGGGKKQLRQTIFLPPPPRFLLTTRMYYGEKYLHYPLYSTYFADSELQLLFVL